MSSVLIEELFPSPFQIDLNVLFDLSLVALLSLLPIVPIPSFLPLCTDSVFLNQHSTVPCFLYSLPSKDGGMFAAGSRETYGDKGQQRTLRVCLLSSPRMLPISQVFRGGKWSKISVTHFVDLDLDA